MSIAYLGLGSNLGDRVGYVQQAVQFLKDTDGINILASSSLYETEPVGLQTNKWFVNAVIKVETTLEPEELLDKIHEIEYKLDRVRDPIYNDVTYASRTLDIDILFYDDLILSTDNLQIPHPRIHERAYALVPMLEIDPDFIHPILNSDILYIHRTLLEPEEVYLYGTRREEE